MSKCMYPPKQKALEIINRAKLIESHLGVKQKALTDAEQIKILAPREQRKYWENVESEIKKLC